jgi:hypothetical protein
MRLFGRSVRRSVGSLARGARVCARVAFFLNRRVSSAIGKKVCGEEDSHERL